MAAAAAAAALRDAVELHKSGQAERALAEYRRLLAVFPGHAELHHYAGMAEHALGRVPEAIVAIRRAIALQPATALFHVNLGRMLLAADRCRDAIDALRTGLQLDADDIAAQCLLARALRRDGEAEAALPIAQRATAAQPQSVQAAFELAETLAALRQNARAVDQYRTALQRDPGNPDVLRGLAHTLRALNRSDEALHCLEQALARQDQDPKLRCELGETLEEIGQFDAATAAFRAALDLRPGFPIAVARLLALRHGLSDPELAAAGERHLRESRITNPVRVELLFALGRHHDGAGDCDAAFASWRAANDIVAVGRRYRRGDMERRIDALIAAFTPELFRAAAPLGSTSERPLLIVGMPRSGTTLTEQLLSSHRDVAGAGELGLFMEMTHELAAQSGDTRGELHWLREPAAVDLPGRARRYLARLEAVSATALRVTDKMPLNFLNLGLIALLFPRARVIHCQRDPMDTCFSCYIENMHQDQRYSTRLASLGHFYRQYRRLMDHWRAVLPTPILDVKYEDVVAGLEAQARRIVKHAGLDWDPACIEFHRTERSVTTPSRWQVRQPIYTSSVGRWRRYAAHLEPLREALAPLPAGAGAD